MKSHHILCTRPCVVLISWPTTISIWHLSGRVFRPKWSRRARAIRRWNLSSKTLHRNFRCYTLTNCFILNYRLIDTIQIRKRCYCIKLGSNNPMNWNHLNQRENHEFSESLFPYHDLHSDRTHTYHIHSVWFPYTRKSHPRPSLIVQSNYPLLFCFACRSLRNSGAAGDEPHSWLKISSWWYPRALSDFPSWNHRPDLWLDGLFDPTN